MIYAISILFPVDENYNRNEPKVEKCLKDLWFLYFYFKYRIDGYDVKYVNIVKQMYCFSMRRLQNDTLTTRQKC